MRPLSDKDLSIKIKQNFTYFYNESINITDVAFKELVDINMLNIFSIENGFNYFNNFYCYNKNHSKDFFNELINVAIKFGLKKELLNDIYMTYALFYINKEKDIDQYALSACKNNNWFYIEYYVNEKINYDKNELISICTLYNKYETFFYLCSNLTFSDSIYEKTMILCCINNYKQIAKLVFEIISPKFTDKDVDTFICICCKHNSEDVFTVIIENIHLDDKICLKILNLCIQFDSDKCFYCLVNYRSILDENTILKLIIFALKSGSKNFYRLMKNTYQFSDEEIQKIIFN